MGIDGPTFVWKSGEFLLKVCLKKITFFLLFEPNLRAGFFDKMLALPNKKCTFVLVSGFFWPLYFHNFVQILLDRSLLN